MASAGPPPMPDALPVSRSATLPPAPTPAETSGTAQAVVTSLRSQGVDVRLATDLMYKGIPITSPAALQYFGAAPDRPQVHLGDYLLLQTLGEGEFGKVKLGVHKKYGEEVAVKLIRRDRAPKPESLDEHASTKMSKIDREIAVLRSVRHPNIVRLYEVVTTDRYIGIVLEYASGGELFDHILAHKCLRDKDACRLFAQLISAVNYLHQKHIVHRDLKLENLLLDRNRNVIVTDFGFANNFSGRANDLMATSCGSPCYAAPELVVQDGEYTGSSVDVWSCGVILYAMLAGYLPFDDDPANPDSDNINQLYHYILSTPLTFPDYVPELPRHLLRRMLVPDPAERATMEEVMAHPWLADYRPLFSFSVEDLERAASEQQTRKRQMYRQQMELQQQLQRQPPVAALPSDRTSHRLPPRSETLAAIPQFTQASHRQTVMPVPAAPSEPPDQSSAPQLPSATHVNRHTLQVEYSAPRSNEDENPAPANVAPALKEVGIPAAETSEETVTRTSPSSSTPGPSIEADQGEAPSPAPVVQDSASHGHAPTSNPTVSVLPASESGPLPPEAPQTNAAPVADQTPATKNQVASTNVLSNEEAAGPTSSTASVANPTPASPNQSVSTDASSAEKAAVPGASVAPAPPALSTLAPAKVLVTDQDGPREGPATRLQPTDRSRSGSIGQTLEQGTSPGRRRMSLMPKSEHRERRNTLFSRMMPNRPVSPLPTSQAPPMAQQASIQSNESASRSWRKTLTLLPARSADKDRRPPVVTKKPEAEVRQPAENSRPQPTFRRPSAPPQSPASKVSTGPARRVMDWFRGRSRQVSEPIGIGTGARFGDVPTPAPTKHTSRPVATHPPPTRHPEAKPASRSTSGTHSNASRDTHLTAPSVEPPVKESSSKKAASAQTALLRYHEGAVDQMALTSVPPGEMLARVRAALTAMGVEFRLANQEQFKLECLRPKRGRGRGAWGALRTSLRPTSQSEERRASDTHPLYGQASVDDGQEVRFSVEVTRLKNLPGLYSLDIRRMRGNVWTYKFCYTALLQRCMVPEPGDPATPTAA